MSQDQEIIEDYLTRLKASHPHLSVIPTPDKPSSYALRHPIGELLVQYASSDYVEPTATGGDYIGAPIRDLPQRRRLNIQITVVVKSLSGAHGATEVLSTVRDSLKKFRPRHCLTQVYFTGDGFISENQGVWQYGLRTAVEKWEKSDV